MGTHKIIKRSILSHLIICLLVSLSVPLQAAVSAAQSDAQESYDYTLQNHADQVGPIQKEAYLDIEEMPQELTIILKAVSKDAHDVPQLLAMVAEDVQNRQYYKYLFASSGLLGGSLAQQKAHNLNYHLVKAPEGPTIWQVLSFLDQKPYLVVKELLIPQKAQLCLPCGHMCIHLFGKKMPTHKSGCQGQSFPTTAAPASTISCFYSNRFTDQQRRLVMSQIEDKVFPDPKKLIMPQPAHNPHKPTFQPIQPATPESQLHMAVQFKFPTKAIEALLADPQIAINALDSSGKTPLDYATQDNDLYHLLVRYNAKTSQQLTQHQAAVRSPSTDDSVSHHSEVDQATVQKDGATAPLLLDQLLIPANGNCLYATIIMGYLLPVRSDVDEATKRTDQLFGMQPAYSLNELHQTLQNPTHYLTYLHSDAFGSLVVAFMAKMKIKKGTWGGPAEMQTIATKLKVNIQAYYPDPSNPTNLVQSDLTTPAQATATMTLHILQDKVHPAEVLTQAEKASAKDNPHYQHYRLKYTLPASNSAPAIGASLSDSPNSMPYNSTTATKHISANPSKKNNYYKDGGYTISNPLVLLTCTVEHKAKIKLLTTVEGEMETLYNLFKNRCGYEVKSTFFDEKGDIFPKHPENEQKMDGKWLYASKLDKWIDTQVNYLQQHGKKYDALIFIFSGHGGSDRYGEEYILTSDHKHYLWKKVESAFSVQLGDHFTHKPKLLFKLACRGLDKKVEIAQRQLPVDNKTLFTYYPTASGDESSSYAAKRLTEFISRYFQLAIYKKHPLSWIDQKLRQEMENLHGYNDIPDTAGKLPMQDIFFDKQGSGTFFNLPATDNLPQLPHQDKHIMQREEDLKDIFDNFLDGHIQQALIAEGGLGKSTLARLYAKKYLTEGYYTHGWWFNAEDVTTLAASIAEVNAAMGITTNDHRNIRQGMDMIEEKLQTHPDWLLIFDNVQDPSKLLIDYLPKDTTKGHILITSRCFRVPTWTKYKIFPYIVAGITLREARNFLRRFHTPEIIEEEAALNQLLNNVTLLPLTLAQIGHYLHQYREDRWSQNMWSSQWPIYQDYLALYKEEHKNYNASSDSIARSIVITFTITAKRIQAKIKEEGTDLKETWRILRVMSFLHPDGLDQVIFDHLHLPAQQGKGDTIDDKQAEEAAKCLCAYGILMGEDGKYRAHRTVQEIMRTFIKKKKITTYIQNQALQLLETMQQQSSKKAEPLRFEMAAHCRTLMGYIHNDPTKRTRLLRLMSQIDSQAYLKAQLYLPPQATNRKPLHAQVIQFVNGQQVVQFISEEENPLLLLTADAGSGKSTYGCYLVEELWQIYYKSKLWAHIPFFISLPAYCKKGDPPPKDLITRALRSKGLNNDTIEALQKAAEFGKQPWVFILDGYDEIYGNCNLFEACNFGNWGTKQSKYIITCRTEYLEGKAKKNLFSAGKSKAATLSIAPFSPTQVTEYIKYFAKSDYNKEKWNCQRYQHALEKTPQLKAWMTTPFLLVIGLQALPKLYKTSLQNSSATITKAHICKTFIEAWMERECCKPQAQVTTKTLWPFCEELAYSLFIAEKKVIQKHDPAVQKFFEHTIQLQSAPLRHITESPGSYQFMHPDFQDFFAASFIFTNIAKNKLPPNLPSFSLHMKDFFLYYKAPPWCYLRSAQRAPSIAANNSLQILYQTGHRDFREASLTQLDLRGINLANAKLPKDLSYTNLSGATLPKDLSSIKLFGADLSHTNLTNVKLPKDLFNTNLTGATLPKDISNTDLSRATLPQDLSDINLTHTNLTGQCFTNIKFEGTQLERVLLTNTTCDYQQCFQDHIKANKPNDRKWYLNNLLRDLESIAFVYTRLSQDSHKATLLQIASGLAYSTCWEDKEFKIKIQYWSSKLLLLKKHLSSGMGDQLVCTLASDFAYDAEYYCWQTNYLQHQEKEVKVFSHNDFNQYLKTFQAGLQKYNCQSKQPWGYHWYKDNIEKNIQGLQKHYPKLTIKKRQQEAIDIVFQLSTLYQHQHWNLLFHYLSLQNRLIKLKFSAGVEKEHDIYYNTSLITDEAAGKNELKPQIKGYIDDEDFDYTYKLLLIGDSSVGKTAIYKHLNGEKFTTGDVVTHTYDYKNYSVVLGDKKVKFSIWDTAGKERYARLARPAYHNTHCVILCYDITNKESFNSCKDRWQEEIENYCNLDPVIILCGTKSDMSNMRVISIQRAEELRACFESVDFIKSVTHLETSAKKGYQVDKLIQAALQCLINCEPRQYGDQILKVGDKVTFSDTSDYPNQKGTVKITYRTCFEVTLDQQPGTTVVVNSKKLSKGIIKKRQQ